MALVICSECSKEISQYSEICPICGFPLQKFIENNNFRHKTFHCDNCG